MLSSLSINKINGKNLMNQNSIPEMFCNHDKVFNSNKKDNIHKSRMINRRHTNLFLNKYRVVDPFFDIWHCDKVLE